MIETSVNLVESPIEAKVLVGEKEHIVKVVKVAERGIILDVDYSIFKIQQRAKVSFSLLDGEAPLEEAMIVVKIHNRYRNQKLFYLVELHFKGLTNEVNNRLITFIATQKSKLNQ